MKHGCALKNLVIAGMLEWMDEDVQIRLKRHVDRMKQEQEASTLPKGRDLWRHSFISLFDNCLSDLDRDVFDQKFDQSLNSVDTNMHERFQELY